MVDNSSGNSITESKETEPGKTTSNPENLAWQWEDINSSFNNDEAWNSGTLASETQESPGIWDPSAFDQQAPSSWKGSKEPKRIQDIVSPLLVEPEHSKPDSDEEHWPFKSPCKLEEKRKHKMTSKVDANSASDIDSEEDTPLVTTGAEGDEAPSLPRAVSRDTDVDEDIESDEAEALEEEAKSRGSVLEGSSSRRGRKQDHEPAVPRRSRRSDDEEDDEVTQQKEHEAAPSADQPRKPRRSRSKDDGDDGEETLDTGSFHNLKKDFDKKPSRSNSGSRRTRTPGSGSGRRRRAKDRSMDMSGHSTGGDEDEFGEDTQEVKLKGGDEGTPGGGLKTWRERRVQNRIPLQAPGSGGARRPRRGQMRRASSERWMRAVEGIDAGSENTDNSRSNRDRNGELSRSQHSVRRYHSGGVGRMSGSVGADGSGSSGRRTPSRRPPRKAMSTPTSDNTNGGEDYEYELNLSGRSARTLDSIEDLEDFEHIDFQTPGMIDYDEEMLELMQRANPEHTAQLQRRVGRKREAVNYDQNMPLMTRQALMTRTASTQVQRQYVDQSTIDRRRLLVRSMSGSSMASSTDELSLSQHRNQFSRGGPARRPPPRTRSSGMAALSRSEHPYGAGHGGPPERRAVGGPPDRRAVARTKSGTSTSSFRYNQKPNRVQSLSRRGPNDGPDSGGSGRRPPDDRRGSVLRAQSMHATVGRQMRSKSPKRPERRIPKSIDKTPEESAPKDDSSFSEDSDLETDDDSVGSPQKIIRKVSKPPAPPKPVQLPPRRKIDKRDYTVRRNRCKLHAMLYEAKMEVDMKDLLRQVQEGEVPRSPYKTLMMPSP